MWVQYRWEKEHGRGARGTMKKATPMSVLRFVLFFQAGDDGEIFQGCRVAFYFAAGGQFF